MIWYEMTPMKKTCSVLAGCDDISDLGRTFQLRKAFFYLGLKVAFPLQAGEYWGGLAQVTALMYAKEEVLLVDLGLPSFSHSPS